MSPKFYRKFSMTLLIIVGLFYSYEIQDAATEHVEILSKQEQSEILSCKPNTGYIIPEYTNTGSKEEICIKEPDIRFFMYHYVRTSDPHDNAATTDLSIDPWDFREHMKYIQKLRNEGVIHTMNGYELIEAIQKDCFPAKRIWVFTSDDGWSDSYTDLFPIAHEYRVPFFIGIIANRLDVPGFVTTKQVQEIAKNPLFTITSHSITHSDHSRIGKNSETQEICESKKILEKIIEKPIFTYTYPEGRMSNDSTEISEKCGYTLAWSTGFGTNWNPVNPSRYDINRIRIHNYTTTEIFDDALEGAK